MKKITKKIMYISLMGGSLFLLQACSSGGNSSTEAVDPAACLVGADWVYPSEDDPTGAWKFSSDGTFNSSTTLFGGMSSWGNWEDLGNGKIQVTYTRGTEDFLPDPQILELIDCEQLKVGQTVYSKN